MNYEIALINPKTSEETKIVVELSLEQAATAKSSPCLQTYVQDHARPYIPAGFMPLGNGVRPVPPQ